MLAAIIGLWELVFRVLVDVAVVPPPSAIVGTIADDPEYFRDALLTTTEEPSS
jgi:hypothetical protein